MAPRGGGELDGQELVVRLMDEVGVLRSRLSEREQFIRENAGVLLAERDARIERQRARLSQLEKAQSDIRKTLAAARGRETRLEKVAAAARAYVTVVGNDDAELDALVDALEALAEPS
jgi:hypothetical protein